MICNIEVSVKNKARMDHSICFIVYRVQINK